ncbi:nuclease domain-containing protein 1-like [Oopsacas minuta]|uniref:Nuclease domain-containing protein 1-like n=1 Tax=Oopsacas minuta TaxID=111878 RepID=A0AAV7KAB4_9METZ|nr:nuclease domain-containing protein 1-like [Oopsacas minuta]
MATIESVSPDPIGDMNSIHQDIPPAPPSLDPPISVPDTSFASQLTKSATPSAPYHPVQPTYKQPPAPQAPQQQDRSLTELTDKGDAIVKQVISGDTLLIRAQKGLNGPPTEQQITLTMIQGPKLGRRPGPRDTDSSEGTQDEPYAWASREFLRQLVIGELVQYSVEITVKNSKKIAKVMYNNENLSEKIVRAGLAKLREQPSKKGTEEYDRIVQFKEEAEALKLGMYSMVTTDSIRNVQTINQDTSTQFVDKHKGKILDGIVEQVLNGNTLRLCIPSTHQNFTAQITGIRCPSRDDPQDDPELGLRAKYAVEIRLLQRDVKIRFDGINNQVPLVTILHVRGNIAEYLIQEGFARVMQWSQKHLPDQQTRDKYKQLENAAKQKGVKIWLGAPPLSSSQSYSTDKKKYQAKVLEIVSAEQLILKTGDKQDSIQKVFLSSTRGPPRKEFESSRPTRALYDQPFFFEAREFLRKWLVGKKVSVEVDYTRPPQDQYSERICVTIIAPQGAGGGTNDNVKNVAEALIIRGLGLAIRHKGGDDLRSQHLDALMRAEGIAKDEGRGLHAKKMPDNAILKVAELSTDVSKARTFQSSLQRSGRVKAVVEYVTSGNRFRVYIPKEQILISFILTGISCPKGPGGPVQQGQEEPYGIDAINFSKEKVLQHDVSIIIYLVCGFMPL